MTTTRSAKKPPRYAEGTTVSAEKTMADIIKLLKQHAATNCAYGEDDTHNKGIILFTMRNRQYRMELSYPASPQDFARTRNGVRSPAQQQEAYNQEVRRLWRALLLVLKAKLEAVQSGILTFEEEFLSHTVLKNNETMSSYVEQAIQKQQLPLLPPLTTAKEGEIPDFIEGNWKPLL